jgi:hypothetical protein
MPDRVPERARDLGLPDWGPYSKRHPGVSHVADPAAGTRFDIAIVPAYFRRPLRVPDVVRRSGFHPWDAAADLSYYSYRHELEWKDRLYCDVSVTALSAEARLIASEFVNNTDADEQVLIHAIASLDFARLGPHGPLLRRVRLQAADTVRWVDALNYAELALAAPPTGDGLAPDGLLRGEFRAHSSVSGSVLRLAPGDTVRFSTLGDESEQVRMRCRVEAGETAALQVNETDLIVSGTGEMSLVDLLPGAGHPVRINAGADIEIDGFAVGPANDAARARFVAERHDSRAAIDRRLEQAGAVLRYPSLAEAYGLSWAAEDAGVVVDFAGDDLGSLLSGITFGANGFAAPARGTDPDGLFQFVDVSTTAVLAPARSRRTVYGLVVNGPIPAVEEALSTFAATPRAEHDALREAAQTRAAISVNPSGRPHEAAQRRMAATLSTNVIYPTYLRRAYVKHYTPGKWYDSLYSWDSGFIALGLVELDPALARDCIAAYLTDPGDPHSAYIHHGSPVPVQQFAFAELFNRHPSGELLREFYPRLRNQYEFLVGRAPGSKTRMPSGLLNTFDYFYNSGGWDDYPAQAHTHRRGLSARVGPMITASMAVRAAKALMLNAIVQGLDPAQIDEYAQDISRLSAAIQRCWDSEAGYFGYGWHDDAGKLVGVLRDDAGVNLNLGLDGVYPLVAGVCNAEQSAGLVDRIFDPNRLWTDVGISTVDQSAPYYSPLGYWNGCVWMAHQWFIWKSMLDLGRPDLARRIADTALNVWTAETNRTWDCWEHFSIATGRGLGWHHFGGLSAPVLNWFATYHRPGRLTTGFDTWVTAHRFSRDHTECSAELLTLGSASHVSAVICLAPGRDYRVRLDGRPLDSQSTGDGVVQVSWPVAGSEVARRTTLAVSPA